MHSHELIRAVLERRGPKTVASAIGLSVPRVYQWTEPPPPEGSGGANPLDRVAALLDATGDHRIADWICHHAKGYFVKNAGPLDLEGPHLMKATETLIKQYTQMLSLISTVVVDGQVSPEESVDLRRQWQSIQSVTESYVTACEKGLFRPCPVEDNPPKSPATAARRRKKTG